jgi:CHAT domain-containing protein
MAGSAALADTGAATTETIKEWQQATSRVSLWHGLLAQERRSSEPDRDQLDFLARELADAEEKLQRAESTLDRSDPQFARVLHPSGEVLTVEAVRRLLPAGTVLLTFMFLQEDLLAWAVTDAGLAAVHHQTIDDHALSRSIHSFHQACQHGQEDWRANGRELGEVLLSPFAGVLREAERVVVVPYGAAHLLPFHALDLDGELLGVTHAVSYLPSASALQYVAQRAGAGLPERILVVGNPAGMAWRPAGGGPAEPAPALPAAAGEAAAVAGLFREPTLLLGTEATKDTVHRLAADYPLLHLATHGQLVKDAPLHSAILLADGEALSVYELMGLRLQAQLVVLSACKTALGDTTHGEEVVGLTRGLLAAGARSAVVSLWKVNDTSTGLLMQSFYRNLKDGMSKADALLTAQRALTEVTLLDVIAYCEGLRSDAADPAEIRRLDRETADLHLQAGDYRAAVAALSRALETLGADDPEAVMLARLAARCKARLRRSSAPPDHTRRPYAGPYYWAPFVLVGDWR